MEAKRLQVIDSGVKIAAAWDSRVDLTSGLSTFNRLWGALDVFLLQEPALTLNSQYMWKLFYKVRTCENQPLASELGCSKLATRFLILHEESQETYAARLLGIQGTYVRTLLGTVFNTQWSTISEMQANIRTVLLAFGNAAAANAGEFAEAMVDDLNTLVLVMTPSLKFTNEGITSLLESALAQVEDADQGTLLEVPRRFAPSITLLQHAREALASQKSHAECVLQLAAGLATLSSDGPFDHAEVWAIEKWYTSLESDMAEFLRTESTDQLAELEAGLLVRFDNILEACLHQFITLFPLGNADGTGGPPIEHNPQRGAERWVG